MCLGFSRSPVDVHGRYGWRLYRSPICEMIGWRSQSAALIQRCDSPGDWGRAEKKEDTVEDTEIQLLLMRAVKYAFTQMTRVFWKEPISLNRDTQNIWSPVQFVLSLLCFYYFTKFPTNSIQLLSSKSLCSEVLSVSCEAQGVQLTEVLLRSQ